MEEDEEECSEFVIWFFVLLIVISIMFLLGAFTMYIFY